MHEPNPLEDAGQRADCLLAQASEEELAETVRLLALSVAHYQTRYGGLPFEKVHVASPPVQPGEAELEARGMEILAEVLGRVRSAFSPACSIH